MTQKTYRKTYDSAQKNREVATREYLEVAYGVQHHLERTNSPQKQKQVSVGDTYASPIKKKV